MSIRRPVGGGALAFCCLVAAHCLPGLTLAVLRAEEVEADTSPEVAPLPRDALARFGDARFRHGRPVTGLVYSQDGKRLISCSQDFTVRIWDVATGRTLRWIQTYAETFTDVALSPDEETLAVASGKYVWLWDAESAENIHRFQATDKRVAYSPDGNVLLTCGGGRGIRTWNVKTGKSTEGIEHNEHDIYRLRFSPDGQWLAGVGPEQVFLWDWKTQKLVHILQHKIRKRPYLDVCFSSDSQRVAAVRADGKISLWSTKPGEVIDTFQVEGGANCLAFSRDDSRIFIGGRSGNVYAWKVDDKAGSFNWKAHHAVSCLAVSPDGNSLATGGTQSNGTYDFAIRQWSADHPPAKEVMPDRRSPATGLSLSADGRRLAVGRVDGWAHVYDTKSGNLQMESHRSGGAPHATLALSPDGKWLARGGEKTVPLVNVDDAKEQMQLETGEADIVRDLTFTRDGMHLVASTQRGRLFIWDFPRRRLLHKLQAHNNDIWGITSSPDGSRIATVAFDGHTAVWDTVTGKSLGKWKTHHFVVRGVAFSPDGTRLASGGDQHKIVITDVATGQTIREIDAGWSITSVGFCDGGRTLVSAHFYDRFKFWDLATGELILETRNAPGPFVMRIAMCRPEQSMYAAHTDSTAIEWDLRPVLSKLPALESEELTPDRAEQLWEALGARDAVAADQAIWRIVSAGDEGVQQLSKRLIREPPKVDGDEVDRLIKQLDDDDFQARRNAESELEKYGAAIKSQLEQALVDTDSAEVAFRVRRLVRRLQVGPGNVPPEQLRTMRAIYSLAASGTPEASAALRRIAENRHAINQPQAEQAKLVLRSTPMDE